MELIGIEKLWDESRTSEWIKTLNEEKITSYLYDEEIKDSERKYAHEKKLLTVRETTQFIYKKDVNLRLEIPEGSIREQKFDEPWAIFNGHDAYAYTIYLYYGASCIKRFYLVSVDEGRAFLPMLNLDSSFEEASYHAAKILNKDDEKSEIYMEEAKMRRSKEGK